MPRFNWHRAVGQVRFRRMGASCSCTGNRRLNRLPQTRKNIGKIHLFPLLAALTTQTKTRAFSKTLSCLHFASAWGSLQSGCLDLFLFAATAGRRSICGRRISCTLDRNVHLRRPCLHTHRKVLTEENP